MDSLVQGTGSKSGRVRPSTLAGAMGIKFHCPNGHKLNVKSFLAGKKGRCPKCGTKVRIPVASEPGLIDSELEETDASAHGEAGGNGSPAASSARPALPAAPSTAAAPAVAAPAAEAPPAVGAVDPIAEAPAAAWYVRPPTGGQYGPARGDVMRRWIAEGRVSSDSLVWREGWTGWRTAGPVFPNLQAASALPAPTAGPTPIRPSSTRMVRYQAQQRGSNSLAITALIFLGVLCVALGGVLLWFLWPK